MKKILLIADGILAKNFLERVMSNCSNDSIYDVITYREITLPEKKLENFNFYSFDPTSFEKLKPLLLKDYFQIMIIVRTSIDARATWENIRKVNSKVQIVMMDRWNLDIEDSRTVCLKSHDVLSSRFVDYLPDVPVVAQNVGLGIGEIMEIRVPVGSSYVYRHIASIEQSKWKIAAIYRGSRLILPRPTLMIHPNDVLLAIGNPEVLNNIYNSIKRELGQFPAPFGNNIHCVIDMLLLRTDQIEHILNVLLLLHSKFNSKKLIINIINPVANEQLKKIKSYNSHHIHVHIEYHSNNAIACMQEDFLTQDIGLFVVNSAFFAQNVKQLHQMKVPVLKIGESSLADLSEAVILNSHSQDIEKESTVIFDVASQLELSIKLYNFISHDDKEKNAITEHYESLSKIFGKKVIIEDSLKNPLLILANRSDILQFIPFNTKVLQANIFSFFATDMDKQYSKIHRAYQLFIPSID